MSLKMEHVVFEQLYIIICQRLIATHLSGQQFDSFQNILRLSWSHLGDLRADCAPWDGGLMGAKTKE